MPAPLVRTKHPGIFSRGNSYVAIVKGKKRSAPNIAEAKRMQAQMRIEAHESNPTDGSVTVDAFYRQWIEGLTLRVPTIRKYRTSMMLHVLPALGKKRLSDLRSSDIARLRDELTASGMAYNGVLAVLTPLRTMLTAATERDLVRVNVARGVRGPTKPHTEERVRCFTDDELARFYEHVHPYYLLLFRFLAAVGVRIGEASALTWEDWTGPTITIRASFGAGRMGPTKSGKSRIVPLSNQMQAWLTEWKLTTDYNGSKNLIFPNRLGRPCNDGTFGQRILHPALKAAGIEQCGFHQFRHTAASHWFRNGVSLKHVQMMLGHATSAVTERTYIHMLPTDLPDMSFLDVLPPSCHPDEILVNQAG